MDDLVSRRAVIDAFDMEILITGEVNAITIKGCIELLLERIKLLPSAQIRCKDCAKREHCRTSTVWAIPPKDDWYCADAERRTDE